MVEAFVHGKAAPCSVVPAEVDSIRILVEEACEGVEFRIAVFDDLRYLVTRDEVGHDVLEVEEDGGTGRCLSEGLGTFYALLDGKLHGFDDKVHAPFDSNCPVVRSCVGGEAMTEFVGNVSCEDSAHG